MEYKIQTTEIFDNWVERLDRTVRKHVSNRLIRLQEGNLGDYQAIDSDLFELCFFFGGGIRVYFTFRAQRIVILLSGGNKNTQAKDIQKARAILEDLEA